MLLSSEVQRVLVAMISGITSLSYIKKSLQAIKCNRVYYTAVELCALILCVFLYQLTQTVLRDRNPGVLNTLLLKGNIL